MTPVIDKTLQSQVDQQLLEQGAFTPLELLLSSGRLVYSDYERWRLGELEFLDQVLLGNPQRIRAQLETAEAYARSIGLMDEPQAFTAWSTAGQAAVLRMSADPTLHQLLSRRFVSQQNAPQLDMFLDNPVVVAVNGLVEALIRRMLPDAEGYLDQLYQQAPNHADLATFDQLIAVLRQSTQPVLDPRAELSALQQLAPQAKRLLSAQCRDFLVPLWRRLADALDGVAYSSDAPDLHGSYLLAQAQDWPGVSRAVVNEVDWWTRETLCLRLAECGYRRQARAEALMAWCYLCWQFPLTALEVLESGQWSDPNVTRLWQQYLELEVRLELDAPLSTEEFPAWLLLTEPGLSHVLAEDLPDGETAAEQLYRTVHRLVRARLSGEHARELEWRKELQARQPVLLSYLKTKL